jgi:hypothetical protein
LAQQYAITVSAENDTPQIPSNRETLIPLHLGVQFQIGILVQFEFVPKNFSFSIWWILGLWHVQWHLFYGIVVQIRIPTLFHSLDCQNNSTAVTHFFSL